MIYQATRLFTKLIVIAIAIQSSIHVKLAFGHFTCPKAR